jgi:hypothetical protein
MPYQVRLTASLAIAVAALACSERPEGHFTEPQAHPQAQITGGPACKLSSLKSAAKTFFGLRSTGYALAQQFTTQNANQASVLPIFFSLAEEIATKARADLTSVQIAAGAEVHRQAVACAPVVDPDYTDDVANVKLALGAGGAYEVRGQDGQDNAVVLSHNTGANGSSGIKPPSNGFAAWTGGAVIFYGFTSTTSLGGEAQADPDQAAVFQWFTVRPAGVEYHPDLRGLVGICVDFSPGINTAQLRIQHEDADDAVVLPVTTFNVCTTAAAIQSRPFSPLGSALAWLRQSIVPAPLQAATLATTSPSGSIKKFSPVEAVNPGGAVLDFDPQPTDGAVSEPLGVKVVATGTGLVPWEGLNIKLFAVNNNGNFVAVAPNEAITDAEGVADFSASLINKTGGYRLLAVTQPGPDQDAAGFAQDSVTSNRFNRSPN